MSYLATTVGNRHQMAVSLVEYRQFIRHRHAEDEELSTLLAKVIGDMQPLAGPKTKFRLHRGRNRHRLAQPSPPIPHLTRCPCQRCARPLEDMEVDR